MADTSEWVDASAATEHTGEPQLTVNEGTNKASNATEHADAASEFVKVELQTADWRSDATEHAADADDAIVLTIDDALTIRGASTQGQVEELHAELREHLNTITVIAGQEHADDVYYLEDSIRWKDHWHWDHRSTP